MNGRSPLPPPPPLSFGKRLMRSLRFYGLIAFVIVVWAGSSLFIAPIVRWGLDRAGEMIAREASLWHDAYLLDVHLRIPCQALETLPPACEGLAEDAGVALEEIETVSKSLAALIQNISNAARQQASSAGHISNTMNIIQEITSQTAAGTTAAAQSVGKLASMTNELRGSVAGFKLPESGHSLRSR